MRGLRNPPPSSWRCFESRSSETALYLHNTSTILIFPLPPVQSKPVMISGTTGRRHAVKRMRAISLNGWGYEKLPKAICAEGVQPLEPHIRKLKDPSPQARAQRGTERSGVSFSSPKIIPAAVVFSCSIHSSAPSWGVHRFVDIHYSKCSLGVGTANCYFFLITSILSYFVVLVLRLDRLSSGIISS